MQKLNVIKVGGQVVEEKESLDALLGSFASLEGARVLVHGGGRTATRIAAQLGIESHMVEGRRVTDSDMLGVVTMVYGGLVNKTIVAALQAKGVNSIGVTGADMDIIRSSKRPIVKASDGSDVDYGFVGDVKAVNGKALADLLSTGAVPVVAPLTHDGKGQILNTNADTMASSVATGLAALTDEKGEKMFDVTLTFCFEKAGVLRDPEDDSSAVPVITKDIFNELVADGTVSGGMIPKLTNAFKALESGVGKVVITKYDALDKGTAVL